MKKTLILLATVAFFGCSDNDVSQETCDVEVWFTNKTCTNNVCTYTVTYGENGNQTTTVEVEKVTYEYYQAKFEAGDDIICWEGPTAQ